MIDRRWWVFIVACLGWMFDTFDQRLFILARAPAMASLLPSGTALSVQTQAATWMTAIFILGWATGGIIFGFFGDRFGRVQTMAITISVYSLFTGLSAFSIGLWDFALYRFLTGLGIGGEFAAGSALIAEVMPNRIRPYALGFMQVTAVIGTFLGTITSLIFNPSEQFLIPYSSITLSGWRLLFLVGAAPAFLLLPLRLKIQESEAWLLSRDTRPRTFWSFSTLLELFSPKWRKITIVGIALGSAGQIGIWAIGTWTPELMQQVLINEKGFLAKDRSRVIANSLLLKDIASAVGIMLFTWFAERSGRRFAFAISFISSIFAIFILFGNLRHSSQIWWMMPLLGITVWSVLGGYSIYFPELFPTRLRSTGIGICYNAARFITAAGVLGLGSILSIFSESNYGENSLRLAAMLMTSCYVIGLLAIFFAPETRRQPLD